MILYRLNIHPDESAGEGEDHDEWFSSERAARRRRSELVEESPCLLGSRYGSDYAIDKVRIATLPQKRLALALLNRRGVFVSVRRVAEPYEGRCVEGSNGRCVRCDDIVDLERFEVIN